MNTIQEKEIREKIEKILHVDWAFKGAKGKPDKVIIQGYPSGGYHLSYEEFMSRLMQLLQQIEEEAYKKMSNRNVAICSKCNSLFKAKHENCPSLQGEQEK